MLYPIFKTFLHISAIIFADFSDQLLSAHTTLQTTAHKHLNEAVVANLNWYCRYISVYNAIIRSSQISNQIVNQTHE